MLSVKGDEHGESGTVHDHDPELGIWRKECRSSRIALDTWDTISKSIRM